MNSAAEHSANSNPLLSICIPTYNRADCLEDCLRSLECATRDLTHRIQIVVSDNASSDHTSAVVEKWIGVLPIRYVRNPENIGAERNFFSSAQHATAEYVWIFGDDDDFGESAVSEVMRYIELEYDVIISNYSSWSKDMRSVISPEAMSRQYRSEYRDPNALLSSFGILLGYISSVVLRKRILLSAPASEYEQFVPYGFPFPYCVYSGLPRAARVAFIPQPLFRRREHNSDLLVQSHETWVKYFIEGPALVFEALGRKGYSAKAISSAKNRNLRDFGIQNIIGGFGNIDRSAARRMMLRHYRSSWRWWLVWLPFLSLPSFWIAVAVRVRNLLRSQRGRRHP
jgi:glycosyltransferase involved in cell wall biosynthesis